MRVLVLGGAGEMGRTTCRTLAMDASVTSVVVADRAVTTARQVADAIGSSAVARHVDVDDAGVLAEALDDCDVVVNTVGPFYRFGMPILSAAISAGRDYVDICDDPEPTLEMLALDGAAKARGVTALVGAGASPGVSNLLALRAARELETVDTLVTGWNIDGARSSDVPGAGPTAAILHGVRQLSGTIPTWRDGAIVQEPALRRVVVDYPGIGPIVGRSFGHPEPVTLHRGVAGLRESTNAAFGRPVTVAGLRVLRRLADHTRLSERSVARVAQQLERLDTADPSDLLRPGGAPPVFAVATGTRGGVRSSVACALAQVPGLSMAASTAVPLAAMVPLVAAAGRPGVHTPETLLDPTTVLDALARHCIGSPDPSTMTAVTRSWASEAENARAMRTSIITAALAPA